MKGPINKKMPDKLICSKCDVMIYKELGGTKRFPNKRKVNYCTHDKLESQIAFIKKGIPYTPTWCPELKGRN